jgi:hypothetical protein
MKLIVVIIFNAFALAALPVMGFAEDHQHHAETQHHNHENCGHKKGHHSETEDMNTRGDRVMGFDHQSTTHHFLVQDEGGIIEVTAKDPGDVKTIGKIRKHLMEIKQSFSSGDFAKPREIHQQVPSGSEVMVELKDSIQYRYEEIASGARMYISSQEDRAVEAIHDFFNFQIQEHKTGDHPAQH